MSHRGKKGGLASLSALLTHQGEKYLESTEETTILDLGIKTEECKHWCLYRPITPEEGGEMQFKSNIRCLHWKKYRN